MQTNLLTPEFANKVYDILIEYGAPVDDRDDFVYHHCEGEIKFMCTEWRFCGIFGFGGKYRSTWNGVTAYSEDITPEMQISLDECNEKLKSLNK